MATVAQTDKILTDLLMRPGSLASNVAASITEHLEPATQSLPVQVNVTFIENVIEYGFRFLFAVFILVAGWFISRWIMQYTYRILIRTHLSETPSQFFASAARFVIIFGCAIFAIIEMGGSPQALLAMTGALVVALGLGLKDTLTNVAAGLMLLINQPFKLGDYISINTFQGTVKRINLFQTELNNDRNLRVYMPNKLLWDNSVINHSHNRVRLVELQVPVHRKNDSAKVMLALQKGLANEPRLLSEPAPFVGVDTFNSDVLITYVVRCWVKAPDFFSTRYGLLATLRQALNEAYLDMPDPESGIAPLPAAEKAKDSKAPKKTKPSPKKKAKR